MEIVRTPASDRAPLVGRGVAEVRRTKTEKLSWPPELADSFQTKVREAFPDATVAGYDSLLPSLANDAKDRHVLGAAIRGQRPLIVTFNLKHFPPEALEPWSIRASHPQDYLLVLYEMEPRQITACLGEIAGQRRMEIQDILIRLGKALPAFSQRVSDDLG